MRSLGDTYVKEGEPILFAMIGGCDPSECFCAEFRRHQKIDNPLHIIGFLSQWKVYLDELPTGPEAQHFKGKKLDMTMLEKVCALLLRLGAFYDLIPLSFIHQMSSEQLGQLYELMQATKDVWKPDTSNDDSTPSKP